MKSCENKLSCMLNEDIGKLILRVSIAGLMLFHGFFKLFNGIDGYKPTNGFFSLCDLKIA